MKFTDKQIEIVKKLKELNNAGSTFLATIPNPIDVVFWDNDYVNALNKSISLLIDAYFGENAEWVSWFLYEWYPKPTEQVWINNVGFILETEEDVYKMFTMENF